MVTELGMRLVSVPRVLRVTEKLNNTGSVDSKFLIVKSRYATQWLQEFISRGIF